jgi:hypothetical protein
MSLRAFHILFIVLSVMLTAFFAAWAGGQYEAAHNAGYIVVAAAALGSGVGLCVYMTKFVRKTRRMS